MSECGADMGNILSSALSCFDAITQSSEDYDKRTELNESPIRIIWPSHFAESCRAVRQGAIALQHF
ncbi:hypothetical protein AGR1B_pa0137 [Agrobacterium fabacearum S56]|nr:hypothetical protein AGR1B_pa0137 [Agrobacterium fabacearum S56]